MNWDWVIQHITVVSLLFFAFGLIVGLVEEALTNQPVLRNRIFFAAGRLFQKNNKDENHVPKRVPQLSVTTN